MWTPNTGVQVSEGRAKNLGLDLFRESFHHEVKRFRRCSSNTRLSSTRRLISLCGSASLLACSASTLQSPGRSEFCFALLSSMCLCACIHVSETRSSESAALTFLSQSVVPENELHSSTQGRTVGSSTVRAVRHHLYAPWFLLGGVSQKLAGGESWLQPTTASWRTWESPRPIAVLMSPMTIPIRRVSSAP